MALSGITTTTLLGTAKMAADQFGLQVAIEAVNRSVMLPLSRRYIIPEGNALYIPKVGTRAVTALTRGTDDGVAWTYSALNDTGITMTKRATYDALAVDWLVMNDLTPDRAAAWLNAERSQMSAALANDFDTTLLGLHASITTNTVGGAGVDVDYPLLISAIQKLRAANAPEPYFGVFDESQWDHLAAIDQLVRFDARGEGDTIVNRQAFKMFGVQIYTTNNVVTSGGTTAKNMLFSGELFQVALRNLATVEDWRDQNTHANKLVVWQDIAYALSFENYGCIVNTSSS